MKKSISRKVLLPILLASFCSGVSNASEQVNGRGNGNQSNEGFSATSMAFSILASAATSGLGGYYYGKNIASQPVKQNENPTKAQYEAVVAKMNKTEQALHEANNEIERLKTNNPDAAKVMELEAENKKLNKELIDVRTEYERQRALRIGYQEKCDWIKYTFGGWDENKIKKSAELYKWANSADKEKRRSTYRDGVTSMVNGLKQCGLDETTATKLAQNLGGGAYGDDIMGDQEIGDCLHLVYDKIKEYQYGDPRTLFANLVRTLTKLGQYYERDLTNLTGNKVMALYLP